MKKTIKYLDNDGNYQYATVKDAGDLDKLKTKAKEDLVSAINELATNGIAAGGDIDAINNKVDQIQQQANQNADALNMSDQERQEMQQQIAQMQAEAQAKIAEMQKLAEEQNKKLQEASAELKKKADAIDVQKMQQDNAEALKNSAKALEDSLAATNEDLQKTADHLNEMEIQAGVVETSVKELQNGFESKVSSADFNEARTKLQEQETMVRQLNNELSTKASNNELDMVTQRVQKAESNIQQNAQGIKASVTKETMYKEMDDFAKYRENRLKYSRDFSNDWSLNGNDIIDDDHLFDTQHDVKSVSIRNGAYLTQTTDLDTDDMSKTFTLAMWVEKGKKPRAWYGSAELTNMKVKEDKGDYQRVYWTFVPTIVKQDIRITGDTSTQGNLIISEPKLEQSDRPSAWSTNTGDQYATTEKLAHDLKLTADKLESTITKQSEFSDRQLQDESRITQTEHGLEVANKTIVSKTDGLRQEFDGKIDATSKSLTTEYQSFTNRALGQMADGGANLILNSSFGSLKNSFDKWTNVNPKARIVTDDNGLKWVKLEQSGLTANSPIGLTSNLFRVKKGVVTIGLDIRSDNAQSIDNDNIVILESYNAEQKRVFTQEVEFSDFKITRETLSDCASHRITYKYNQTRDDTQYMAVHIVLPKNGILYATNVLARTIANGEDSGEYAPNDADLREQVVQQRTRIEQNDQAIALKADQTKVTQDIDAAKSSLSGAISKVEQRAANLEVKADGITSSVSNLTKTVDGIQVGGRNLQIGTGDCSLDLETNGNPLTLEDYDDHTKMIHTTNGGFYTSYSDKSFVPIAGKTYTISADVKGNGTLSGGVFKYEGGDNGNLGTFQVTDSWQRVSNTVYINEIRGQWIFYPVNSTDFYLKHLKIEEGNMATDWTPAPEDTDSSISSLQARASKLEQTDSEIKASVTSVTNDLKNGKATLKEGIMSMTDDHLETKFSSINGKIDGISVGGTNLVKTTSKNLYQQNVTGTWYYIATNDSHDRFDLTQYKGETISARAWIDKPSADAHLQIYTDNGFAVGNTIKAGQSGYSTITGWKVPTSFNIWNVPIGNGRPLTMGIKEIKIEKGNKPTDWSPAPEDVSEEIKSAKDAAIQVASDQINLHVNELSTSFDDKLNKRVNEVKTASEKFTSDGIEQTVTKITNVKNDVDRLGDKVNGIQVGGRNLLISTSENEISGKAYNFADYQISGGLQPNKTYTLSGWARVDQNSLNHRQNVFIDAYSEDWSWSVCLGINASVDWQYNKLTFTTPVGKQLHPYVTVYLSHPDGGTNENNNDAISGMAFIKKLKLEEGNIATDYTHAPEDIDKKIDTQTLDSANIDDLKTQGHYFVKNLTGNPVGGWVYVDVTGNNNDRIRQDVYQDNGSKHMYRRGLNGTWSGWEQGAYLSDVNSLKTEVTASVKNLGDRVTTEVNSVTTKINNGYSNDTELIKKSDFEDGDKGGWVAQTIVAATNPAPPAELGQSGMKVLQVNNRDNVEQGTWYSVKPGEKFDVDFWACPSTAFHSTFGLQFVDKNHQNYNWEGVQTDQSGQWKHYKGVIQAPPNATFAMPWFQMEKPADNTTNTAWLAKPHIRRQNPAVVDAINSLNTKWDVANGQIQGKVTATDVNNILNGKGYATQSWAQTMFTMKSDAITLQAVRDNITNGIQNQVNDANNRLNNLKIGARNLLHGTSDKYRTLTGDGYLCQTTATDFYTSTDNYNAGDWFTYAATITNNSTKNVTLETWLFDGNKASLTNDSAAPYPVATHSEVVQPGQGDKRVSTSFRISGYTWYIRTYVIFDGGGAPANSKVQVKDERLVEGNMAGAWSPNPDDIDKKIDTQTLDSANIDQMKTQGHYFVKNLTGNPIGGWVYVDVTGNNNDRIKQDVYQDNGGRHKYRRWVGSWTEWVDDVNKDNILSQINISPEKIRLLSNKIEIDGNTYIHGTLNVPTVILKGKSGQIDLTGDNILVKGNSGSAQLLINSNELKLTNGSTSGVRITPTSIVIGNENKFFSQFSGTHMGFYYKTDKLKDLGLLGVGFDLVQQKSFGLTLFANPAKDSYGGGEFISLGYNDPNKDRSASGVSQISLYAKDVYSDDKKQYTLKGIHINDHMYIHQDIDISNKTIYLPGGGVKIKANGTQDPLFINGWNFSNSMQSDVYQPTLMAGYSIDTHGDSGISFLWNSVRTFGTLDLTGTIIRVADTNVSPQIGWVSFSKWNNEKHIALFHNNSNGVASGYAMSSDGVPVVFDTVSAAGWRGGQWAQ